MKRLAVLFMIGLMIGLGCDRVRPIRSPADDIVMTPKKMMAKLPDDCEVRELKVPCHIGSDATGRGHLAVSCEGLPPDDALVGSIRRCMWLGTAAELQRAVCRAGGDTIIHEFSMTDSCIEEDLDDRVKGTSAGYYLVYRLRN
jgi:hypothetical protein